MPIVNTQEAFQLVSDWMWRIESRLCALEIKVENFTSTNKQSNAIAALRAEVQHLREVVGQHQSFVGLHQKLGGNSTRL